MTFQPSCATREEALKRLENFIPKAAAYTAERNYDRPGHSAVSRLSPYHSRRLLGEWETVAAVRAQHKWQSVIPFVQEVNWRTYWKGWLEMRPSIWEDYRLEVHALTSRADRELQSSLQTAFQGNTGIEPFDHWVRELIDTGYLHNHARMWFASIWIFTLKLPWQLGADFFLRHLLDGDAASNTLSWRWVAGLQTAGKHYLARAENIAKFTDGRFDPRGQLNEQASAIVPSSPLPAAQSLEGLETKPPTLSADERLGLLLHTEDCLPEQSPLENLPFISVAAGINSDCEHRYGLSKLVRDFNKVSLDDTLNRASSHFGCPAFGINPENWVSSICEWTSQEKLTRLFVLAPAIGPAKESLDELERHLPIPLSRIHRKWDADYWPFATAGYFKFRKNWM